MTAETNATEVVLSALAHGGRWVVAVLRTARPRQWPKNLLVFAAPLAGASLGRRDGLLYALVAAAAEAGVTILAGTDSRPHGRVADEIRSLAAAGLTPHQALAAGSWTARAYLGLGSLTPGAPADAVVYDADPRTDLTVLDRPRAVILRGRLVRP